MQGRALASGTFTEQHKHATDQSKNRAASDAIIQAGRHTLTQVCPIVGV